MKIIFKKQFFIHLIALIICFSFLGVALIKVFNTLFINQKESVLVQEAEKIANLYKTSILFGDNVKKNIKNVEEYLNCSFIILSYDNTVIATSSDIKKELSFKEEDLEMLNYLEEGEILHIKDNFFEIRKQSVTTIGYPVFINNVRAGLVIVSSLNTGLLFGIEQAYKIIIPFMLIAVMTSFVLVYLFSRQISIPLIKINNAAKIMSEGNFEKQIDIKSRDEIGQLANILNEMAKKLNEQEKYRREFISNISHDIRSPLTSMKGFLQALIDGTIPENKKEKYLNIVLEETERLTRLSNNILDINLQDINNECKNVKFNINTLIKNIILSFETRVTQKQIKLNLSFEKKEIIVLADIEKVERIIYNLVDNAIKFTDDGKGIYISTSTKGEKALISIKDEGKGIPKHLQARVFDRFYKVDTSRGEDKKGSGLGLSIVKDFILAHEESITLNSEPNKGSEFVFTLKLYE